MQIVINIDEDYVKIINKNGASNYPEEVIKNGTPLQKGHGRIADMDEAIKCIEEVKGDDAIYAIALIEWACGKRTIIEADKSESEEKNICSTCANANNVVVCPYTIKDIAAEEGCKFWHEAESEEN